MDANKKEKRKKNVSFSTDEQPELEISQRSGREKQDCDLSEQRDTNEAACK